MRPSLGWLALFLLGAAPAPLPAQQQICRDTDTIDECRGRMSEFLTDTVGGALGREDEAISTQETALAAKPTGVSAVGIGLTSVISDFLPVLAGALGFTMAETEHGAAAFESN